MFQTTQKTVDEIVAVNAALVGFIPKIRVLLQHLRTHAALVKKQDPEVLQRKEWIIELLREMKRHTEGVQQNAMLLYRSGIFPSASSLVQILNSQHQHLRRLIGYVEIYDSTSAVYKINTEMSHKIEAELAELEKLYTETLLFLKKKEKGVERAAA